jgi:two-component system OmpR family response regulator
MTFIQTDPPAQQLLVVEDDAALCEEIGQYLRDCGYQVRLAADAFAMDQVLQTAPVDLIILDVMLPGEDGLSACRRLSDAGGPPILMISGRAEQLDRVLGLELGADDYLAKPFAPRELLARVRAILRRQASAAAREPRAAAGWRFAGFLFDTTRAQLKAPDGGAILLTPGEIALLNAFLLSPRRVLSREELLEQARGEEADVFDRAIDVQISRLRRKLHGAADQDLIKTVRGAGYVFDTDVAAV